MDKILEIKFKEKIYVFNRRHINGKNYTMDKNNFNKNLINQLIALYFGFTKNHQLDEYEDQWLFPNNFPFHQCSTPNSAIPDFISILKDYIELSSKHGNQSGYPRQWENIDELFNIQYNKMED